MRFMNTYDIARATDRYDSPDTPNLAAAVRTLANLAQWADENSDGWAYWPKPARAAAKLMLLIEGDGTNAAVREREENDVTRSQYRAALAPVKAFLTRQDVNYDAIVIPR